MSEPDQARRKLLMQAAGLAASVTLTGTAAAAAKAAVAATPQPDGSASPHRIIIDTDPGVDDALAIFLALRSPEVKVEAITPVAGNVPLDFTLPNALRLLEIAGRTDIPVAAGASGPLRRKLVTAAYVHGNNGLGGIEFPEPKTKPVAESAPQLIRRIVRSAPGEVSIIAIGPLTNLALALQADPQLAALLRGVTIMGGSLSGGNITPAAEFNSYVDPEAAQVVYRSGARITMIGLNVTRTVALNDEHVRALEQAGNPAGRAAGRIMRATQEQLRRTGIDGGRLHAHDSMAAASFIDPSLVTLEDFHVEVETKGELTAGETVAYRKAPMRHSAPLAGEVDSAAADSVPGAQGAQFRPNAQAAVDVQGERFLSLLIGRLAG